MIAWVTPQVMRYWLTLPPAFGAPRAEDSLHALRMPIECDGCEVRTWMMHQHTLKRPKCP